MVRRLFPEPEPEPRIRLVMPSSAAFAEVVATAAEILLAAQVEDPEPTVSAVREAASAVLAEGSPGATIVVELSRETSSLTLRFPSRTAGGRSTRQRLAGLSGRLSSSRSELSLTWALRPT